MSTSGDARGDDMPPRFSACWASQSRASTLVDCVSDELVYHGIISNGTAWPNA